MAPLEISLVHSIVRPFYLFTFLLHHCFIFKNTRPLDVGNESKLGIQTCEGRVVKPATLGLYDPKAPTKVSVDAYSYSLGVVLIQEVESKGRPIAYVSRSMTDTERSYAQIEKGALVITWACKKFSDYILGKPVTIETDHKPLVPLLGMKNPDNLPPCVLCFATPIQMAPPSRL